MVKQQAADWAGGIYNYLGALLIKVLPWALLFAFIGFLLALVVMIVVSRKRLLRRSPRAWNAVAKLSYLAILSGFVLGGGAAGVVSQVQRQFNTELDRAVLPALEAQVPVLREYLTAQLRGVAPNKPITARDLVDAMLQDLYYQPKSNSLWEKTKAQSVNWVLRRFGAEALTAAFQQMVIMRIEATGEAMKKDMYGQAQGELVQFGADALVKLALDANKNVDFTELDKKVPQVFTDALRKQGDGYFHSLYTSIGILFGGLALLVVGEMLFYFRWYIPRKVRMAGLDEPQLGVA